MIQLCEILDLRIPRIYASSSDSSNAVGAEYIIEEKASGKPLGSVWYQWSRDSQLDMIAKIVDFERKLASISFPRHGCIYYKADLEVRGIAGETLMPLLDHPILQKFTLGPLTEARHWDGARSTMILDRGPCKPKQRHEATDF